MTVVEAGNEEGLDDSRTQWTTPAVTEIAVAAVPSSPGGVYTFLPLRDDLTPPLAGHLNAPFYNKSDRTGCDRERPLNTMLLDAAALGDSAEPDAVRLAVDLVSWQAAWAGRWPRRTQGRGLLVAEVIGDLISLSRADSATASLTGQLQALAPGPVNQHRDGLLVRRSRRHASLSLDQQIRR
ncbi:hypothetical protein ACIA8E_04910 [Streptomyces sp. NPDC051664]|uniref:hypothetical protein n=1 Tax=Streptomyces sp. NPDC051664 TaxID=3365668 RepID=UPI0037ACD727